VTLIPTKSLDELAEESRRTNGFVHGAVPVEIDPLTLVRAGAPLFEDAYYFATPNGDRIGGLGIAWRSVRSGPDRFTRLREDVVALAAPSAARFLLGYAFSPDGPDTEHWSGFGSAEAVLPQVTIVEHGRNRRLLVVAGPGREVTSILNVLRSLREPDVPRRPDLGDHVIESHPPVSDWCDGVAEAVAAIGGGSMLKVVLARSVVVRSSTPPDALDLVWHLEAAYPLCFPFAWRSGGATFLGASPELLLRVEGQAVWSNPLAGSAPRGEGEAEDRVLGSKLMASLKDRTEHALVVEDIAARLRPLARRLDVPPEPELRRMASVQHLSTEIRAGLARRVHLLDLVEILHPTPAVGGTPRGAAEVFIEKMEGIDRAWYSGGIGWLDGAGDGAVALALRCGLVRGATAYVYAGAGIVGDSDPDAELAETRLKLRPMLELLTAT
jgi:salicylate biosynthesis isochorismate synthase